MHFETIGRWSFGGRRLSRALDSSSVAREEVQCGQPASVEPGGVADIHRQVTFPLNNITPTKHLDQQDRSFPGPLCTANLSRRSR